MGKSKGPVFLRFCIPIVEVLRELGGSGRPAEVTDLVIDRMNLSAAEAEATLKNGGSRVRNQVAWARFYMVKAGLISSSQRGVWGLTENGSKTNLDEGLVLSLFQDTQQKFRKEPEDCGASKMESSEDDTVVASAYSGEDYKSEFSKAFGVSV